LDYVGVCPTLFQQYIAKATELRITVVGNSVFAAEMYTQIDPRTTIDWRRGSPVAVPHRPVTLPPAVERCCLELVHRLGLTFGAIDMVRTPDGEFVFLEINPNGQWAWIEGLTGLQIAKKIAEVLSNPPEFVKNF
jgi:glutathione synthase/RimK-type ligase-like ATP-grasp enzyme